jgi:hypothetical protein
MQDGWEQMEVAGWHISNAGIWLAWKRCGRGVEEGEEVWKRVKRCGRG